MKDLTDQELVNLARSDNEEAKEELFRRSKDTITYSIRRYKAGFYKGLNPADIEDLSSECSIAVMDAINKYDGERGAGFTHFLKYTIKRRLYKWVENRVEDDNNVAHVSEATMNNIAAPHLLDQIRRDLIISVKNERDRYIIDLFLQGMRQTEIADEFKITKGRVNQIIKECIK